MATDTRTKAELLEALKAKESENKELAENLDKVLDRLSATEKGREAGKLVTAIDTKDHGTIYFHGKGINISGTVYTASDLKRKENHDKVISLLEKGSDRVTSKA